MNIHWWKKKKKGGNTYTLIKNLLFFKSQFKIVDTLQNLVTPRIEYSSTIQSKGKIKPHNFIFLCLNWFCNFVLLFIYFVATENYQKQSVTHASCHIVKVNTSSLQVNKRKVTGSSEELLESTVLWCRKAYIFRSQCDLVMHFLLLNLYLFH